MSSAKGKQIDPLEKAIEAALSPGRFISYNGSSRVKNNNIQQKQ